MYEWVHELSSTKCKYECNASYLVSVSLTEDIGTNKAGPFDKAEEDKEDAEFRLKRRKDPEHLLKRQQGACVCLLVGR